MALWHRMSALKLVLLSLHLVLLQFCSPSSVLMLQSTLNQTVTALSAIADMVRLKIPGLNADPTASYQTSPAELVELLAGWNLACPLSVRKDMKEDAGFI